jgi:hypothetical protein
VLQAVFSKVEVTEIFVARTTRPLESAAADFADFADE